MKLLDRNPTSPFEESGELFSSEEEEDFDLDSPDAVTEPFQDFADVFSKTASEMLPEHRRYDCEIILMDGVSTPPHRPLYNLSVKGSTLLDERIEENMHKGYIRPSTSSAGAPIFFVPKKDGTLRPVVDCRGLNEVTVKNRCPLPLISNLLD